MITFTFYGFLKVAEQSSNRQEDAAVNNAAVVAAVEDAFGKITQNNCTVFSFKKKNKKKYSKTPT